MSDSISAYVHIDARLLGELFKQYLQLSDVIDCASVHGDTTFSVYLHWTHLDSCQSSLFSTTLLASRWSTSIVDVRFSCYWPHLASLVRSSLLPRSSWYLQLADATSGCAGGLREILLLLHNSWCCEKKSALIIYRDRKYSVYIENLNPKIFDLSAHAQLSGSARIQVVIHYYLRL